MTQTYEMFEGIVAEYMDMKQCTRKEALAAFDESLTYLVAYNTRKLKSAYEKAENARTEEANYRQQVERSSVALAHLNTMKQQEETT